MKEQLNNRNLTGKGWRVGLCLYVLLLVCLAAATIIEKYHGTPFVQQNIYGAWWFSLLWGLLVAIAIAWICKQRMHRWSLIVLHTSFVVILAGALLTHLTAERGSIHLRIGQPNNICQMQKGNDIEKQQLPYSLTLDYFEVKYHEGMQAVADYVSHITIDDSQHLVSMNHIMRYQSQRFYQGGYDEDLQGCTLAINADPWGIPVTYTGYALLFVALAAILIKQRKTFPAVTWSWIGVLAVLLVALYIRMRTHQLLPVLRSPFFSLHISTIVTSYALLLGILVVGVIALVKPKDAARMERLKSLSTAMLYPAVALLAIGIFIGAVWANVSWGNYWSWDPKEVWALITLLVYAMPLFSNVLTSFRKPMFFHIYTIIAFLSVIITYFGVNLILGGIHAYN